MSPNLSSDPGMWSELSQSGIDYWMSEGLVSCRNRKNHYQSSKGLRDPYHPNENRYRFLHRYLFFGRKANSEIYFRNWLCYSSAMGNVVLNKFDMLVSTTVRRRPYELPYLRSGRTQVLKTLKRVPKSLETKRWLVTSPACRKLDRLQCFCETLQMLTVNRVSLSQTAFGIASRLVGEGCQTSDTWIRKSN